MAYCSTNCCEETPEQKIRRKKDEEIDKLKDVIVDQAKEYAEIKRLYFELIDYNTELRDERNQLRRESNDMDGKVVEIKHLLKLAKECADDTTKSERQREVSKIRIELLNDVIDVLEGKNEKPKDIYN